MTVPGRRASAALLLSLDPPPWFVRHARAVAEVASWLAVRTAERGRPVDAGLVEAAALLHDVDKLVFVPGPDGRPLPHGTGTAAWLRRLGWDVLAPIVASHPVTILAAPGGVESLLAAPDEVRIVAYADKRSGQRLEPMEARFASWARRYPVAPGDVAAAERLARMREGATALEAAVCRRAGVEPAAVRRLGWTGRALEAARADAALSAVWAVSEAEPADPAVSEAEPADPAVSEEPAAAAAAGPRAAMGARGVPPARGAVARLESR